MCLGFNNKTLVDIGKGRTQQNNTFDYADLRLPRLPKFSFM